MMGRTLRRHSTALLVAATLVAALLAVSVTAPPADAGKPPPPAPPSTSLNVSTCAFTVTYTWAGFKGGGLSAELRLVQQTGSNLDIGIAYFTEASVSGTGSVTHTFNLTNDGSAARTIYARASLMKRGNEVSGSRDDSTTVFSTCGAPIN
jgi:hypothetical protein